MYFKLCEHWQHVPPVAQALRRLNAVLGALAGIKPEPTAQHHRSADVRSKPVDQQASFDDNAAQAAQAGMAVYSGRPNDPMLDFIEQVKPQAQ